ncbi:hypothetical protein J5X84_07295 [Streptosporangiaceae bacterium NEAU-GS5]|nr:hypothetical protein [Streptosporangiaceae bacterium NEAU-GS5]
MRILAIAAAAVVVFWAPPASAATQVSGGVFFKYGASSGVDVYTYRNGAFVKTSVGGLAQFAASPDGTKVAWIDIDGKVHVKQGASDKVVAKGAIGGAPCATPVWSADSSRIAFPMTGTEGKAPIAIVGATGTGLKKAGKSYGVCHLAWSANGRYLAGYAGGADGVYLLDVVRHTTRKVPGIKGVSHVQSLSPTGGQVVVRRLGANAEGGDGAWPYGYPPSLVNTTTGKQAKLPAHAIGAMFLKDGRLAVRIKGSGHNVIRIYKGGKLVQSFAEPKSVRNVGWLWSF